MARTLIVTGGHGALGSAVCKAARAQGWNVALIDHAEAEAPEGVFEVGGVDLTDAASTNAAVARIAAHFGGVDALFNIAGGFVWQTVDAAEPAWDRMYRMNVVTALNASRAALPHLKASTAGRIVNVGAGGAVKAAAGMGAYAASKAGVHRLTEALAEELKGSTVTVNAVLPSIIDTAANRRDMPDADFDRWVKPEQLAAVMLFLASPEAAAVTGALIPVTGGV